MGPDVTVWLQPWGSVYVEVPKVACTSFKVAFAGVLGISLDGAKANPHEVAFPSPPEPNLSGGGMWPGLFSFAFVRNPWARLVSCYRDKILGEVDGFTFFTIRPGVADCLATFPEFTPNMSFEAFVTAVAAIPDCRADVHFRQQHTFVVDSEGEVAVDFIGRLERLDDDMSIVSRRTAMPTLRLPRLQSAHRQRPYTCYYTALTKDAVAERYARDIELFGYAF